MCAENLLITSASTSITMIHFKGHGNGHVKPWWAMLLISENIHTRKSNLLCFNQFVPILWGRFLKLLNDFGICSREQLEKAQTADPVS